MKKRIHLYELECYKKATDEQRNKMVVRADRYFDLEGLPSESIRRLLETFIWERGKELVLRSQQSELLYYNNIRNFLMDKQIKELKPENTAQIIKQLKAWMLENGYAITTQKYRMLYDEVRSESSSIEKHMRKILTFIEQNDEREETEKDVWQIKKLGIPLRQNPIKNVKTINFTRIPQHSIRDEVKKVVFMHLKYEALGTVLGEMTAINRFVKFLQERLPEVKSLQDLKREQLEEYLMYLQTEDTSRKNYRSELYGLRSVIGDVGNLYGQPRLLKLFLNNDFPSTPRYNFNFYSEPELRRLNEHILKMDEQIARALMIHQLLGTRISDALTLKTDCLRIREGKYFVRIDQVKSITYEKAISDEVAQLILKAIEYTQERYGDTTYIFVTADNPEKPYQYGMIQYRMMKMIREEDIRDDYGELMAFGTHIFRHNYGKKLTEMHVEDWMIAKLLGHRTLQTVHHYRKIGNKMMAEETRKVREKMDMILLDIVKEWDGYEL